MYQPIENYGLIGDMRTAALVGMNGSIDWLCWPDFDSPAVFGQVLDHQKGGFFRIAPTEEPASLRQFYWPDTNVLVTRFFLKSGIGQVTDYMPLPAAGAHGPRLLRQVRAIRGNVSFELECRPAFDYARQTHSVAVGKPGVTFSSPGLQLRLLGRVPLEPDGPAARARFVLNEGQAEDFALVGGGDSCPELESHAATEALFEETVEYWLKWLSRCTYRGRWREVIYRSALALKLLTYEPSGAIVAAPTASLPEQLGGVRNWDYRYTWIRDAAFTLYAFIRIGFTEEAERFMKWLDERCHHEKWDGSLQIMYGIRGQADIHEVELDHLEGYRGSRPVRMGNRAYRQLQLDVYGELMDAVYLYNKYGAPISYDLWVHLRRLLGWLCENWRREDEGIWEVRGPRRPFVFSKLMCWVALDRGLRLAEKRSFPADRDLWLRTRDEIYEEIMNRGWNRKLGAFVQSFEGDVLDASNLLMPLVFFVSPSDPRMLSTLRAIRRPPAEGGLVSNALVYRYDPHRTDDGLPGTEGSFNMCTFWLVEALTRAGREDPAYLREARMLFEEMLGYANHLGLYSEETGPGGEAMGNFPQALTHLSLISATVNLDRVLSEQAQGLPRGL